MRVRIPSILSFSASLLAGYFFGFLHEFIKREDIFSTFQKGDVHLRELSHFQQEKDHTFCELDYLKSTDRPPVRNVIDFVKSLCFFPSGIVEYLFGIWFQSEDDYHVPVSSTMPSVHYDFRFRISIHKITYRLIPKTGFFVRRGFRMGMRGAFPVLCLLNRRLANVYAVNIRFYYFVGDDALVYLHKRNVQSYAENVTRIFELSLEKSKFQESCGHIASYYLYFNDHGELTVSGRYKMNLFLALPLAELVFTVCSSIRSSIGSLFHREFYTYAERLLKPYFIKLTKFYDIDICDGVFFFPEDFKLNVDIKNGSKRMFIRPSTAILNQILPYIDFSSQHHMKVRDLAIAVFKKDGYSGHLRIDTKDLKLNMNNFSSRVHFDDPRFSNSFLVPVKESNFKEFKQGLRPRVPMINSIVKFIPGGMLNPSAP